MQIFSLHWMMQNISFLMYPRRPLEIQIFLQWTKRIRYQKGYYFFPAQTKNFFICRVDGMLGLN